MSCIYLILGLVAGDTFNGKLKVPKKRDGYGGYIDRKWATEAMSSDDEDVEEDVDPDVSREQSHFLDTAMGLNQGVPVYFIYADYNFLYL